jgi:hypothetical protein
MTSPPIEVEVVCPHCGTVFRDWFRPSVNLSLGEEWTKEELEAATTVRSPECGTEVAPGSLIVEEGGKADA